jgi:quercetin dioxygenase-like cupin family protein
LLTHSIPADRSVPAAGFTICAIQLCLLLVAASGLCRAQIRPLSAVKFEQDDDVKCLASAVESGNPAKGPSTIILKAPPNCLVPWHYHTAQEQLIVVQGNVQTEMEGMPARPLGPGGFAMMPGEAKHQFSCQSKTACVMFVTFDRTYDIFWVKDNKTK